MTTVAAHLLRKLGDALQTRWSLLLGDLNHLWNWIKAHLHPRQGWLGWIIFIIGLYGLISSQFVSLNLPKIWELAADTWALTAVLVSKIPSWTWLLFAAIVLWELSWRHRRRAKERFDRDRLIEAMGRSGYLDARLRHFDRCATQLEFQINTVFTHFRDSPSKPPPYATPGAPLMHWLVEILNSQIREDFGENTPKIGELTVPPFPHIRQGFTGSQMVPVFEKLLTRIRREIPQMRVRYQDAMNALDAQVVKAVKDRSLDWIKSLPLPYRRW